MTMQPLQAAIRFGLGPRPDQPLPDDPLAWLEAQLDRADAPAPLPAGREAPPVIADGYRLWDALDKAGQPGPGQPNPIEENFRAEAIAAMAHRIDTDLPFRERLVEFWANHFTVSKRAGYAVSTVIGPYMREAIRPHVTGRFVDMLLAVETHPAMLGYLDQGGSIGPNSPFGLRSGRGLNENLAREIMELHTLSPASGYTQQDVTEFARLMTGWSYERKREPLGTRFRPPNHEPGPKTVFGKTYPQGPEAYEQALRDFAAHPATARFVCTKLARHFVDDAPTPETVAALEGVFRESGGDLRAVSAALIRLPQAWAPPLSKLRAPVDYITAAFRAAGGKGAELGRPAWGSCFTLNQPYWTALQPNGWPDEAPAWLGAEPVMQRLDWAYDVAGRFTRLDPMEMLETALGPLAGDATRQAVRRAGSKREAIALVFASAEFQRR